MNLIRSTYFYRFLKIYTTNKQTKLNKKEIKNSSMKKEKAKEKFVGVVGKVIWRDVHWIFCTDVFFDVVDALCVFWLFNKLICRNPRFNIKYQPVVFYANNTTTTHTLPLSRSYLFNYRNFIYLLWKYFISFKKIKIK